MATTSLIVEVLVIGMVALSAVLVFATGLANPATSQQLIRIQGMIHDLSVPFAMPILAITYALGWIVNFVSERLFKILFQNRLRGSVFPDRSTYEDARITVLQRGSSELVHEVLIDRHIIRLGRAGVLNFGLLGIGFLVYGFRGWTHAYIAALLAVALAVLSYGQWRSRYLAHYQRIRRISEMLLGELQEESNKALEAGVVKSRAARR